MMNEWTELWPWNPEKRRYKVGRPPLFDDITQTIQTISEDHLQPVSHANKVRMFNSRAPPREKILNKKSYVHLSQNMEHKSP